MARDDDETYGDILFRDLPPGYRRVWIGWAKRHDWGRNAFIDDEGVMRGLEGEGHTDEPLTTGNKLRDWAGY